MKQLAYIAGFDSNNWQYLQDALRGLTDVRIEWNVLEADGKKRWGRSAYLAEVEIVERSGIVSYVYPPTLRRQLANPAVYARINLAVQARFGSGYALALYENCVRFRKVGTTGWISVEDWRGLLGVEDSQYTEYKYLNKQVLKRATDEVNRYSDIRISMETRKEGRSVAALRFSIAEAPQGKPEVSGVGPAIRKALGAVPDPLALAPEPAEVIADHPLADLQRRLLAFGLTEAQALDLSTEFPPARVGANLDHVQAEIARGRTPKNVAAYTVSAVRADYAGAAAPPVVQAAENKRALDAQKQVRARDEATRTRTERADAEQSRADARRMALDAAWSALSEADQATLSESAVALMRAEAPEVHRWYLSERDAGTAEAEMRPSVRTTLRDYRDGLLAARG